MSKIEEIKKASNLVRMHRETIDTLARLRGSEKLSGVTFSPRQLLDRTDDKINIPEFASLAVKTALINALYELSQGLAEEIEAVQI